MIDKIYIRRSPNSIETPGTLTAGSFSCKTLELPYLNNAAKVSAIPCATYSWRKVAATSKIPYEHIAIDNVPGRSGICIHIGNYASAKKTDVLGCILTGSGFSDINKDGVPDLINSKLTFLALMKVLDNKGTIVIE